MLNRLRPAVILWCFNLILVNQSAYGIASTEEADELLRNRIEVAGSPPRIVVGDELIYTSVVLSRFYERRTYRLAWSNDKGPLSMADELLATINEADREGLRANDYHRDEILQTLSQVRENKKLGRAFNPRRLVDLDLLLTDAFLIYGSHLLAGRINPQTIDSEWFANRREADLADILQNALTLNEIRGALESLLPPQSGYSRLRQTLANYRKLADEGGWPRVPDGPKLQKGSHDSRVTSLRERLRVTGDLPSPPGNDEEHFDEAVDQAVRRFQQRHGLEVDGVVGTATVAACNVSVTERINQIMVNLERWRWLPQELGQRHILVNIANFELDVVEDGQVVMDMRVIVGRDYRRTPVFSDQMTYLVLCPHWHVPPSIAARDILPLIRRDSTYLVKQKMKVFQGWGVDALEVNPGSLDWSQITAKNFNYRLRQDPGPINALGRVKFMFPNQFNVYLHDTPARELFRKTVRTFSSGCIRIEKPLELVEYVLRGDPRWSREKMVDTINKWQEQTVRLPTPIPIHLLYWTAWVNSDGLPNFRGDIYGRDKPLYEVLLEAPPGS